MSTTSAPRRLRGHELLAACAVITEHPWVSFPEGLTERFPDDKPAVDLGLESYLAVCLRSSENVHLGHIAVLDARPMEASEDDGVGGADVSCGTGLSGLADRVDVLKGCFDVESPAGGGTRVHASIPLAA